ncbi:MAG TPA: SCO family protein [Marmoricola sp.]|jgi:protein SCO1/2|nr:SCO family protein [Marmoricola sp.]
MVRVLVGLVACLAVLSGCGSAPAASSFPGLGSLENYQVVPGAPLGPAHAAVTDVGGSTWRYDATQAGKLTLLYFGYTSCPDICPTTMADLTAALSHLPSSVRAKIAVQFVSTDPARDTLPQIKGWLSAFDPTFTGGRAPIGQVITAAKTYGIGIAAPVKKKGDYQVTHGAQVLVLESGGRAVGYFDELAGVAAYRAALPVLVKKYVHS